MLIDLYSKRLKRQRGDVPEVYQYDTIPGELRVQVAQIITDALEAPGRQDALSIEAYEFLHKSLAREYGMFALTESAEGRHPNYRKALFDFFLNTDSIETGSRHNRVELPPRHDGGADAPASRS